VPGHAPPDSELGPSTDSSADPADDDEADDESDDDEGARSAEGEEDDELSSSNVDGGKHRARGGCPSSMVRVHDFCVDRYEAPNRRGAKPLVMQSANDSVSWCAEHRKRLCTEDEWISACEGEDHSAYPYGETHVDGRCNDDKPWKKVDEATLGKWPAAEAREHAKELYQATPSGYKRKCVAETGARDMTGNVEEWVLRTRDHDNDWPYLLVGCYWSGCYGGGKPTCHSTNDAHGPEFRFYETGFRCCKDAKKN
jgi:formylglycine-generating enzyme required for sulfatase activity